MTISFTFIKGDISDKNDLTQTFQKYQPDIVINLAAQAGVEGIERIIGNPPIGDVPHKIFNIGNCKPDRLMVFIQKL